MIDALPLQPAPGHSAVVMGSYGRVVFTPPEAGHVEVNRPTGGAWRAEPLPRGGAVLRDAEGNSWGTFANAAVCAATAERLSR
jgi:hypothetical protein